jgi:hypothetical protein
MGPEVLQKYKAGGSGGYTLVYDTEGMDDPFGDYPISSPVVLSNEKEILLPGEVTLSATMDEQLNEIFDSYGGSEQPASIAAYIDSNFYGSSVTEDLEEDEEEEKKEEEDLYSLK